MSEKDAPAPEDGRNIRFGRGEPKPGGFIAADWTVIKESGDRVAARHNETGEVRKLPKAWLRD